KNRRDQPGRPRLSLPLLASYNVIAGLTPDAPTLAAISQELTGRGLHYVRRLEILRSRYSGLGTGSSLQRECLFPSLNQSLIDRGPTIIESSTLLKIRRGKSARRQILRIDDHQLLPLLLIKQMHEPHVHHALRQAITTLRLDQIHNV